MAWDVITVDEVVDWLLSLDQETATLVDAAIEVLRAEGPMLGSPLVKRIQGSIIHNMKELRPGSAGTTEIRILFVFDPSRQAVLLVGGDKSGAWRSWYVKAIPLAEKRYKQHLKDQ